MHGIEKKRFKFTWDLGRGRFKHRVLLEDLNLHSLHIEEVNLAWDSSMENKPQRGLRQRNLKLQGI